MVFVELLSGGGKDTQRRFLDDNWGNIGTDCHPSGSCGNRLVCSHHCPGRGRGYGLQSTERPPQWLHLVEVADGGSDISRSCGKAEEMTGTGLHWGD